MAWYRPPKYTCLQYEDWNKSYSLFDLTDVLGFFREIGPVGYLHKERKGREKKRFIIRQLGWVMGCPDTWLTLLLCVSLRVFPNEISIWTGRLGKVYCLKLLGNHPTHQGSNRTKREKENWFSLSLTAWAETYNFSCS